MGPFWPYPLILLAPIKDPHVLNILSILKFMASNSPNSTAPAWGSTAGFTQPGSTVNTQEVLEPYGGPHLRKSVHLSSICWWAALCRAKEGLGTLLPEITDNQTLSCRYRGPNVRGGGGEHMRHSRCRDCPVLPCLPGGGSKAFFRTFGSFRTT